jgi:hypothetical protein
MCKRVAIYGGIAFVVLALALVSAGPLVRTLPDQDSPYLDALADISAPPASASPPCNYLTCVSEGHTMICDQNFTPTRCTISSGGCSTTTDCNP